MSSQARFDISLAWFCNLEVTSCLLLPKLAVKLAIKSSNSVVGAKFAQTILIYSGSFRTFSDATRQKEAHSLSLNERRYSCSFLSLFESSILDSKCIITVEFRGRRGEAEGYLGAKQLQAVCCNDVFDFTYLIDFLRSL